MSNAHFLRQLNILLRFASAIVPAQERSAWRQEWTAELTFVLRVHPTEAGRFAAGMLQDALWLRAEHARRWCIATADHRSPSTCLIALSTLFVVTLATSMLQTRVRHAIFSQWGYGAFCCFLAMVVLSLPSTFVTRASHMGDYEAFSCQEQSRRARTTRWLFLVSKMVLTLLTSFLLSVELTRPFVSYLGVRADWLVLIGGLAMNIPALNWVLLDQKSRCPECMRSLLSSARIGPPSRSFLAWNGIEETCDRGHGLLHLPEWETSWFRTARWLTLDASWHELFRP